MPITGVFVFWGGGSRRVECAIKMWPVEGYKLKSTECCNMENLCCIDQIWKVGKKCNGGCGGSLSAGISPPWHRIVVVAAEERMNSAKCR